MVEPQAEERIIEIVVPRDGREHLLHGLLSGLAGPLGDRLPVRRRYGFVCRAQHSKEVALA